MRTTLTMSVTKAICFSTTLNGQSLFWLLLIPLFYLMDVYVFSGIKWLPKKWQFIHKKWFYKTYWAVSIMVIMGMVFVIYTKALFGFRMPFLAAFFFSLTLKICALPFILIDDLRRYFIHNQNKKPNNQNPEIIIGEEHGWGDPRPFGIAAVDERQHLYIIGKTGSGKTTLLRNLILQHIALGHGVGVIDPHGDLAEELLNHIPPKRADHLVYFNPGDIEFPIGLNVIGSVAPDDRHLVASGIHNHPSGESTPSEADIKVTRDLIRAGQLLKIELIDHVVIGNQNHSSLRELGYMAC